MREKCALTRSRSVCCVLMAVFLIASRAEGQTAKEFHDLRVEMREMAALLKRCVGGQFGSSFLQQHFCGHAHPGHQISDHRQTERPFASQHLRNFGSAAEVGGGVLLGVFIADYPALAVI